MKKLWKQIMCMLLAVTMLAGSVPLAGAAYEEYLPTITGLEKQGGEAILHVSFPELTDSMGFTDSMELAEYTFLFYFGYAGSTNQIPFMELTGRPGSGTFPISIINRSHKNDTLPITISMNNDFVMDLASRPKPLAEKETEYHVSFTVLPAISIPDITFVKEDEYGHITANLGSGYPAGTYAAADENLFADGVVSNEGEPLILSGYDSAKRETGKVRVGSFTRYTCTGISADGKTAYMEVTQPQYESESIDTSSTPTAPTTPTDPETPPYIYDEADPAENLDFSDILSDITDQQTAEKAIEDGISQMTPEQKSSPTGVDKATLLAEEVAARANMKPLSGGSLNLKKDDLSSDARTAVTAAEKVLNKNGIETQRVPRAIQTYDAGDNKKISVQNEILSGDVDQIRVSAGFASATASAKQANDFTMEDRGNKTVEVKFNTNTDNMVTVSFPGISADDKYMAVVDENGNPVGGKYNPVTGTLEAKLTASGIYRVVNNEKDFADIKSKSKEMQDAIKLLASKGVINGTSETTFAPDSTISRAEIAALLMRTLSLLDPNANGGFTDVTSANWFYGAAGSAKKHNIISGFEDNTFRGLNVIAKNQIVAVAARTLRQQMNYKTPSDIAKELSVYGDNTSVENWAREDVALATMCNLVMKRTDGNFGGTANMTRGDAAIIIKRLFDKIW